MKKFLCAIVLAAAPFIVFSQLQLIQNFGSNPGNLDMYLYAPPGIGADAPVVVAMHGCTQTASQFAQETGWNTLADNYGFYVIYPGQKITNNSTRCFNWFEAGDINRGQGEASSIRAMVDQVSGNHSVDAVNIYVTGFSAGGGMTSVMMAAYPDVFAGGAIMSGLPYKAAIGFSAAFAAMNSGMDKSPQQWGDLARAQNSAYNGAWPRVAIFHGSSDFTVTAANVPEIVEQWTNLHNTDAAADAADNSFDGNSSVARRTYEDASGTEVVVTYEVSGMGHAVAVDPGANTGQGGQTGAYASDVNLYSCYRALEFWGLAGGNPAVASAPSGLSVTALSSGSIRLNWTDNADNESAYLLERSEGGNGNYALIATLPANTTSFLDAGLQAGTTYFYRLRASNSAGNSPYSNEASLTTEGTSAATIIEQPLQQGWISALNLYDSGQSFTLSTAGAVTRIDLLLYRAVNGSTLRIFEGNTTLGIPVFEQEGISLGSGWQPIIFANPPALNAGQYTFELANSAFGYTFTDTYAGGNLWHNGFAYPFFDAAFRIYLNGGALAGSHDISLSEYRVYPNPARDWIVVEGQKQYSQPTEIRIFNGCGQLIRREASFSEATRWDISGLDAGLYLIKIQTGKQQEIHKLLLE